MLFIVKKIARLLPDTLLQDSLIIRDGE